MTAQKDGWQLWADIVDFGVDAALKNIRRKIKDEKAVRHELNKMLLYQHDAHREGLCRMLERVP